MDLKLEVVEEATKKGQGENTEPTSYLERGVTFAARLRDYSKKINKKMYKAALRSIFSELLRQKN